MENPLDQILKKAKVAGATVFPQLLLRNQEIQNHLNHDQIQTLFIPVDAVLDMTEPITRESVLHHASIFTSRNVPSIRMLSGKIISLDKADLVAVMGITAYFIVSNIHIYIIKSIIGQNESGMIPKWEVLQKLGEGASAWVFKVRNSLTKDIVAIKVMKTILGRSMMNEEIKIHSSLSHPNVIQYLTSFETKSCGSSDIVQVLPQDSNPANCKVLVTQFADRGDLFTLMRGGINRKGFPKEQVMEWGKQLVSALVYLKSMGIVHRDLKLENVLFQDNSVKLTDFGLSAYASDIVVTDGRPYGTIIYWSPEVSNGYNYSYQSDVWALGVLLFELLTGMPPFSRPRNYKVDLSAYPPVAQKAFLDLADVFVEDPSRRISIENVANSPFFKETSVIKEPIVRESTLQLLERLFKEDPRLARTKPTRRYNMDPIKWSMWQQLATPDIKQQVRYIQYHFDEWLKSLAFGIDTLIANMETHQCDIYVSTGIVDNKHQSSSELWMYFIFEKVMTNKGYLLQSLNNAWSILKRSANEAPCKHLLLLDDFVRSGAHMSERILHTPSLYDFMMQQTTTPPRLYILTPIMVKPEVFREVFADVAQDFPDQAVVNNFVDSILPRVEYLTGIYYDIEAYPYIIVDHNGTDKYDSEIAGGHLGNGTMIGPLLEGDSVENPYRYPPPLYHLEFGDGKLPQKVFKFKPIPGKSGIYEWAPSL